MALTPAACAPCGTSRTLSCETDSIEVCEVGADVATVTSVPASVTTVDLLAANTARRGAAIYNNSSSALYVKLGAGASPTSFTFKASSNAYFEVPFNYTGQITGVWEAATGSAEVTEVSS